MLNVSINHNVTYSMLCWCLCVLDGCGLSACEGGGREVTPQISWLPPLLRALPSMACLAWHATAPPFIFGPRVIKTILSWRWGSAEQKLLTFLPNPKTR